MDNNKPKAIMFFGPQGSGKGTQKNFLKEELVKITDRSVVEVEAGLFFRQMVNQEGYTNSLVQDSLRRGELQPDFLSTYGVSQIMINNFTGEEHLIFDGFPRKELQAKLFHQMVEFYKLHIEVVIIRLSEEESLKRLMLRGRDDDTEAGIKQRLGWYHEEVEPLLEYFKTYPDDYTLHEVEGDQTMEEVFADVKKVLKINK